MRSLVSIKDVAESVCINDLGDSTLKYMAFILDKMSQGYREMSIFMSDTFSVVTESFAPDMVINMPNDFIEPTKVGVKVGDKLYVLWRDYGSLNSDSYPGSPPGLLGDPLNILDYSTPPDSVVPFYNYCGTNVLYGYTVGINPSGFYNFNRNNGTIEIGSKWPAGSEVIVEYKSDGVSSGLALIPTEWETALSEYALWKFWRKKRDLVLAREHRNEYLVQYYMVKNMYVDQPLNYIARIAQNTPRQTINNLK